MIDDITVIVRRNVFPHLIRFRISTLLFISRTLYFVSLFFFFVTLFFLFSPNFPLSLSLQLLSVSPSIFTKRSNARYVYFFFFSLFVSFPLPSFSPRFPNSLLTFRRDRSPLRHNHTNFVYLLSLLPSERLTPRYRAS